MDDVFYGDLAKTASGLIAQFGQPCVLSREGTGGTYNVETGTVTDVVDVTFNASAVKLDYKTQDTNGNQILAGDVRFLIGFELNTEPKSGEVITLTRNNEKWNVVIAKPLDPGGVTVIYDVQARK